MHVGEAFIYKSAIEAKLRPYLKPGTEFDKVFSIYLKLHSSSQHFKSSTYGKLISTTTYHSVVKQGKVHVVSDEEKPCPSTQDLECRRNRIVLSDQQSTSLRSSSISMSKNSENPGEESEDEFIIVAFHLKRLKLKNNQIGIAAG